MAVVQVLFRILDLKHIFAYPPENRLKITRKPKERQHQRVGPHRHQQAGDKTSAHVPNVQRPLRTQEKKRRADNSSWLLSLALPSHYRPLVFGCCNLPLIVRLSYLLRASYHMANASSYLLRLSCPVRSCGLSVVRRTPNVDPTDEPSDSGPEDES